MSFSKVLEGGQNVLSLPLFIVLKTITAKCVFLIWQQYKMSPERARTHSSRDAGLPCASRLSTIMNYIHFQLHGGPKSSDDSIGKNNAAAPADGIHMPEAMQNHILRHPRHGIHVSVTWRDVPGGNL